MKKLLLINFGGPENEKEIYPFLRDLFRDPYLFDIPLPEFIRLKLADLIAKKRTPKVTLAYQSMNYNGGSPLVNETRKQADALGKILKKKTGENWEVKIAMTCGSPNLRDLKKEDLTPSKNNIILPLFPHYSRSTVESAAQIIRKHIGKHPFIINGWIHPFYSDPKYLEASRDVILDYFKGKNTKFFFKPDTTSGVADWKTIPILFSAHGIPQRLIKKGDSYRIEIEDNVRLLGELLRKAGHSGEYYLSFQSKVGPVKWTEPFTKDMLPALAKKGVSRIAVYPVSFISDHLETLEEIGVELKNIAHNAGISEYYRIPAHGTHPSFINAIAEIIAKLTGKRSLIRAFFS